MSNSFNKNNKRTNEDEDQSRESKCPRIKVDDLTLDDTMDVEYSRSFISLSPSPSPSSPASPSITFQDYNGVSNKLDKMSLDNIEIGLNVIISGLDTSNVAKNFSVFAPFITSFLDIGSQIIKLYNQAKHNKEICGLLIKRCNFAMAAVRDLDIRRTENVNFFSKQENLKLFVEFIKCMKKIQNFIAEISQLKIFKKYLYANKIEENFTCLVTEFEGYMSSLNFSFTIQSRDELSVIKNEIKQIKEILICYGVSDDRQSQQNFFDGMNTVTEKNIEFQKQSKHKKILNSSEFKNLEKNEPLLHGKQYRKTNLCPSKKIEKRTSYTNCEDFCFKEFSNNSSTHSVDHDETQIEIRRQVNILKELKNSDHIIRFFGVAQEDTKYYLVTEWMKHGNLHEYYTNFRDSIDWKTKINFALDICRGVAYLHECEILHRDIQSANILVNEHHKVKIANFGLSRKFSDITRNILQSLENIRYMAPEKLLINSSDTKKKKVSYDDRCEIYSVGALLWEIAELKKPHSDLNKSEAIVSIRKRVKERYCLPFSDDVPHEWKHIVSKAMEYDPMWRYKISDICLDFYKLSEKYSDVRSKSPSYYDDDASTPRNYSENEKSSTINNNNENALITILSVDDAINEHKSPNGNKRLAWHSFSFHSHTNIEAKYWVGYYYYHEDIPELQFISSEQRIGIAIKIFKETAEEGNPLAQLEYGLCLWKGEENGANSVIILIDNL
ncbi:kinase-like domain-containing protein [Glomus cerebriforme]|uniref:Kinase-like domain-containing protein n=1 Tax=Glomus cerebriforme TaxID=658196 RepID=A0A397S904_9GLOM|nr:kinase-like domain-containing protein [Glomus cerebriforme]